MRGSISTLVGVLLAVGACSDDASTSCPNQGCPSLAGAPTFAGIRTASPDQTGARLRLTWAAATDDKTAPDRIVYRVYVSTHPGHATTRPSVVTSPAGATSLTIQVSPPRLTHYVVVRAVDADGIEDSNVVEKGVLATGDTIPPAFGGLKAARPEPGGGVTLEWDPATDDRTDPEAIRYVLSEEGKPTPIATVEGVSSLTLKGIGAPGDKRRFSMHALDAADNADTNAKVLDAELGPDNEAPTFSGCATAEALGATRLRVTWPEAGDNLTKHDAMTYEIYVSTGAQDFAKPVAKVVGQTQALVEGLQPNTTYHVVCRARDAAGNQDPNTADKVATTKENSAPPVFAGATAVVDPVQRTASLAWAAATDDRTLPSNIVYVIYEAYGTEPFDFSTPRAVTLPGVSSAMLTGLPSRATLRWIVRARDEDFNEDTGSAEISQKTQTSWSLDVLPLFAQNCAVVGCHSAPNVGGGISFSLSAYNAYQSIVDVNAAQRPTLKRVAPGNSTDSYLYKKITLLPPDIGGNPMPAPGTGNVLSAEQKEIIRSWIDEGALPN